MESAAENRPAEPRRAGRHNQRLRARKYPFAQACGRTLFVDESKTGAVAAFAVNEGNLTQLGSSPHLAARWRNARRHRRQLAHTPGTTPEPGRQAPPLRRRRADHARSSPNREDNLL